MNEQNQLPPQLPNATATLVLGILSVVFGCFFIGLVLGIIALSISKKGKDMYLQNPKEYSGYGALNAGRILAIIGVVLGALYTVYYIILVAIIGGSAFSFWNWDFV